MGKRILSTKERRELEKKQNPDKKNNKPGAKKYKSSQKPNLAPPTARTIAGVITHTTGTVRAENISTVQPTPRKSYFDRVADQHKLNERREEKKPEPIPIEKPAFRVTKTTPAQLLALTRSGQQQLARKRQKQLIEQARHSLRRTNGKPKLPTKPIPGKKLITGAGKRMRPFHRLR